MWSADEWSHDVICDDTTCKHGWIDVAQFDSDGYDVFRFGMMIDRAHGSGCEN